MKRNTPAGFTLIELLIAVAVVAILAAIAYPSYRMQVEKTRRAEIQAELMSISQCLERKYSEYGCYNYGDSDGDDVIECDDPSPKPLDDCWTTARDVPYDISIVDGTLGATTYLLKATPKGSQAGNGAVYIDHAQRRFWDENNDGDTDDAGEDDWKQG